MAMFRREFKNKLTEALEGKFTIVQFLEHPDFQVTVRNDPKALHDWVFSPDPEPKARHTKSPHVHLRLHTLLDWALSARHNPPNDFRLNHMAALYLSSPSRCFWEFLMAIKIKGEVYSFETLLNFVNEKFATIAALAGNFQLILESWLRCGRDCRWIDEASRKNLEMRAIFHITVFPFQVLLCHLLCDFSELFSDLRETLAGIARAAAAATFAATPRTEVEIARWRPPLRPALNWQRTQIPKPVHECGGSQLSRRAHGYEERREARRRRLPTTGRADRDSEYHRKRAYFLLLVLQTALREDPGIAKDAQVAEVIEPLLMCGVYGDGQSLASKTAFGVLKVLVYGTCVVEGEEDADGVGPIDDGRIRALIDQYAADFEFSDRLTGQMIGAFPLFWNHRYPGLDRKYQYDRVDVKIYDQTGMNEIATRAIVREPGETPLEHYGSWLLDDPAVSDELNTEIRRILLFHNRLGKVGRFLGTVPEEGWLEYQENLLRHDTVFFEFIRTKFKYGSETMDLSQAIRAFPYNTSDPEKDASVPRVALNGNILWLLVFLVKGELFYDINGITDLGRKVAASPADLLTFGTVVLPWAELVENFDAMTVLDAGDRVTTGSLRGSQIKYWTSSPPPADSS
jgi:hypothetical protein